jgi:excisionase family DNA binding protein
MTTQLRQDGGRAHAPAATPPSSTPADERLRRVADQCYTVEDVAGLLQCSTRHVWRLHDAARMPAAVRIGRLVRWPRKLIEEWIADGCPPARRESR